MLQKSHSKIIHIMTFTENAQTVARTWFYCLDHTEGSLLCFNLGRHAIIKLTQTKCFFDISSCL